MSCWLVAGSAVDVESDLIGEEEGDFLFLLACLSSGGCGNVLSVPLLLLLSMVALEVLVVSALRPRPRREPPALWPSTCQFSDIREVVYLQNVG